MATAFKIERDVPLPEGTGKGRPRLYPFPDMQVGESFAGEYSPNLVRAAHQFAKRNGLSFTTRRHGNTVRVWRVS